MVIMPISTHPPGPLIECVANYLGGVLVVVQFEKLAGQLLPGPIPGIKRSGLKQG